MTLLYNPLQVVFVSCRGRTNVMGRMAERDYLFATSRHMPLSESPPLYAIATEKGQPAAQAIRDEGRFVVNFMGEDMARAATILRQHRTSFEDPFKAAGLGKADGVSVPCPRVHEAAGWAECEVIAEHDAGESALFIGRVLHADLPRPGQKRLFHVEGENYTTTR